MTKPPLDKGNPIFGHSIKFNNDALSLIGGNQFPYFFTDQAGNNLDVDLTSVTRLSTSKHITIDTNRPTVRFGYFETEAESSDTTDGFVSINDSLLIIKAFFDDIMKKNVSVTPLFWDMTNLEKARGKLPNA